jgi:hypothetical protein
MFSGESMIRQINTLENIFADDTETVGKFCLSDKTIFTLL